MKEMDNYLGAKSFEDLIPILLKDEEVKNLLKKELSHLDIEEVLKIKEYDDKYFGEVHDILLDHVYNNAEIIEGIEIDLNEEPNEDPEIEPEYNFYNYTIRGIHGIFFTESYEDDTLYFDSFEKAVKSIELNFSIELDKNYKYKVSKDIVDKRITADEAIQKAINLSNKPKA